MGAVRLSIWRAAQKFTLRTRRARHRFNNSVRSLVHPLARPLARLPARFASRLLTVNFLFFFSHPRRRNYVRLFVVDMRARARVRARARAHALRHRQTFN